MKNICFYTLSLKTITGKMSHQALGIFEKDIWQYNHIKGIWNQISHQRTIRLRKMVDKVVAYVGHSLVHHSLHERKWWESKLPTPRTQKDGIFTCAYFGNISLNYKASARGCFKKDRYRGDEENNLPTHIMNEKAPIHFQPIKREIGTQIVQIMDKKLWINPRRFRGPDGNSIRCVHHPTLEGMRIYPLAMELKLH